MSQFENSGSTKEFRLWGKWR